MKYHETPSQHIQIYPNNIKHWHKNRYKQYKTTQNQPISVIIKYHQASWSIMKHHQTTRAKRIKQAWSHLRTPRNTKNGHGLSMEPSTPHERCKYLRGRSSKSCKNTWKLRPRGIFLTNLFQDRSIYLSIYPSIHLSFFLSLYLSICTILYISIYI